MKRIGFDLFLGNEVKEIDYVVVEEGDDVFQLCDHIVFKLADKLLFMHIAQDKLEIHPIESIDQIEIQGEFEVITNRYTKNIYIGKGNQKIKSVTLVLCSTGLDDFLLEIGLFGYEGNDFILGICFGADEMKFVENSTEFWELISRYRTVNKVITLETIS